MRQWHSRKKILGVYIHHRMIHGGYRSYDEELIKRTVSYHFTLRWQQKYRRRCSHKSLQHTMDDVVRKHLDKQMENHSHKHLTFFKIHGIMKRVKFKLVA